MAKAQKFVKKGVEWKGYLNVNLTVEQDLEFDAWKPSQTIQLSDLDIFLNNGYKFGLSWDSYHDGVVASFMANDPKLSWAGYVLTAWDTNVNDAMLLLFYKHFVVCEEDWEHFTYQSERQGKTRG